MKKHLLWPCLFLFVVVTSSFADNDTGDQLLWPKRAQSARVLAKILGNRHVLCHLKGADGRESDKGRTEFFAMRRLSGRSDVAFFSELTQARELIWGYEVSSDGGKISITVGDDSPHAVFEISIENLKKIATDANASQSMSSYDDDEDPAADPTAVTQLVCRVPS